MERKTSDELPVTALETIFLPLMNYYSNIKRLLFLFATIPVTTCMSERSFSSLGRIKTYLFKINYGRKSIKRISIAQYT